MCEAPVTHQKPCGEAGFVSYTFWPFKAYRRPARSAVTGAVLEMSPWPTSAERAQTGDGLQIASSGTYAFIQRADVITVNLFCREAMHACYLTQEIMGNLHPASASYQSSLTENHSAIIRSSVNSKCYCLTWSDSVQEGNQKHASMHQGDMSAKQEASGS